MTTRKAFRQSGKQKKDLPFLFEYHSSTLRFSSSSPRSRAQEGLECWDRGLSHPESGKLNLPGGCTTCTHTADDDCRQKTESGVKVRKTVQRLTTQQLSIYLKLQKLTKKTDIEVKTKHLFVRSMSYFQEKYYVFSLTKTNKKFIFRLRFVRRSTKNPKSAFS